jgi:hypothetical protein
MLMNKKENWLMFRLEIVDIRLENIMFLNNNRSY